MKHYDIIIVGGGTTGSNAAKAAVREGASVVLIRNPEMSNTCIRQGCMPSKAVLATAAKGLPFVEIMAHKCSVIERLSDSLDESLEQQPFEIIWGTAQFSGENEVTVSTENGDSQLTANRFIIATGASGFLPPIDGLDTLAASQCFTSDDVVGFGNVLSDLPRRLAVVGAGPIGLEMATFFSRLNVEVLVVESAGELLPHLDPEFREERLRAATEGYTFPVSVSSRLTAVEPTDSGITLTVQAGDESYTQEVDSVLIATGRKPNLEQLDVEKVGLVLEKGRLAHDEKTLATNNPNVYVAGDVTGHHQLLHIAAAMGRVAGCNATSDNAEYFVNYDELSMAVIFEQIESASVGLTQEQAKDRGIEVVSACISLPEIGRGITDYLQYGLIKLVAEKSTGQVLGGQMLGAHAGEVIQILSPVIWNGNTVNEITQMTWYHPTYSELWKSLANKMCESECVFCPGA
jgi:pyruvate/2-oxoglutarate dehydrogenase complex dihydrolipoamide dehydrogenase (E3) component